MRCLASPAAVGKLRHEGGCAMHEERVGMQTPASRLDPGGDYGGDRL